MPFGKEARICSTARSSKWGVVFSTIIACIARDSVKSQRQHGCCTAAFGHLLGRCDLMRMFLERRDVALRFLIGRGAESRPRLHQPAPLLEQVGPAIGCFGPVLDRVSERGLDDFAGERRALGCPVAEAGAKAVNCATPSLELLG